MRKKWAGRKDHRRAKKKANEKETARKGYNGKEEWE